MSIIERVTGAAITKPLAIGLAVSLFANLIGGLWLRTVILERNGADQQLQTAIDANTGNVATIESLRGAVELCVGQEQDIENLAKQAAADLAQAEAKRAEASRLIAQNRERIYANDPNCRAWATGPVCVAVSDSLR